MVWIGVLIAICSGVLMSVQGVFNTGISKNAGLWPTGAFVSLTAAMVCMILWDCTGKEGSFSSLFHTTPRYLLLSGALGAAITGTVVYGIRSLGTARAELIIVIAQLSAAYLISVLGLFTSESEPFSWQKLCALLLSAAGVLWYSM